MGRRTITDEEFTQSSSTPFFATLGFILACGLLTLYLYSNTIINENRGIIYDKNLEIYDKNLEIKRLSAEVLYVDKKLKDLQKLKLPNSKQMDMLRQIEKYKIEIKRQKVELDVYEKIQLKSNKYIEMLLLKINETKNKKGK